MGFEIAVSEHAQRCGIARRGQQLRGYAVVTEERHDINARRQKNQSLCETHQQLIDLVGLGPRFDRGDAAWRESPRLALINELALITSVPLAAMRCVRQRHSHVSPKIAAGVQQDHT